MNKQIKDLLENIREYFYEYGYEKMIEGRNYKENSAQYDGPLTISSSEYKECEFENALTNLRREINEDLQSVYTGKKDAARKVEPKCGSKEATPRRDSFDIWDVF